MDTDIKTILDRLTAIEDRLSKIEGGGKIAPNTETQDNRQAKKPSLGEFLVSKKPTDDVKKTLGIGYFLEKSQGLKTFNIKDLEVAFERAKEKKPSNMNDKVNMNIRNGHMAEATEKKDSRKAWYLTNSGEQFVEAGFRMQS